MSGHVNRDGIRTTRQWRGIEPSGLSFAHLSIMLSVMALGCGSQTPTHRPPAPPTVPSSPAESSEYLLRYGDVLDIKFFYTPELNESVLVRPDGRISLQLIGELEAVGQTPSQLKQRLRQEYSSILDRPEVTVIVKEVAQQGVYVGGEVGNPGLYPLRRRLTALQAIYQAGGPRRTGQMKNVVLLRYQGTEHPSFAVVNLQKDLDQEERNDFLLSPYDIVVVPKSAIASMNQFVDQYIRQMIPIDVGVTYFWNDTIIR